MTELHVSSIPMMGLIQEACEALVTNITVRLPHEFNTVKRAELIEKRSKAIAMVEHIRNVLKTNEKDSR